MTSWRPPSAGEISLGDHELARIGFAVVTEGHSKALACALLRTIEGLDHHEWIKLDRQPLNKICDRLKAGAVALDPELLARIEAFDDARIEAHELRHIIVHVTWGTNGDDQPFGFDFGRQREVTIADIDEAVSGCAEMKRSVNWAAMRLAELVENGVLPERDDDAQGVGIHTGRRLVRL